MASFKIPITTMLKSLLFLSLFSLSHLVSGDDKLVEIVCHETDEPEICVQCLRSAHGADTSSKLGIATAVITCLEEHGTSLGAEMTSIASGAKEDYGKRLFEGCSKDYSDSNKDLVSAVGLLKGRKYDGAEKAVTGAFYRHESCRNDIGAYKNVTVPSKVAYEMKIYEDLCQVADRIIERL